MGRVSFWGWLVRVPVIDVEEWYLSITELAEVVIPVKMIRDDNLRRIKVWHHLQEPFPDNVLLGLGEVMRITGETVQGARSLLNQRVPDVKCSPIVPRVEQPTVLNAVQLQNADHHIIRAIRNLNPQLVILVISGALGGKGGFVSWGGLFALFQEVVDEWITA